MKAILCSLLILLSVLMLAQSDGTIDLNFGGTGKIIASVGTHNSWASSMQIQDDGKIVLAGNSIPETKVAFTLLRFNEDGTLDNNFGTNGIVYTEIGMSSFISSIIIQPDGKIIASGSANTGENIFDWATVRYNEDGSLDDSFGNNGIVLTNIENSSSNSGIALQSSGKIVVNGYSSNGISTGISSLRYNSDGSLDLTYGVDGFSLFKIIDSPDIESWAIDMDVSDNLYTAGMTYDLDLSRNKIIIAKFLPDGAIDNDFGISGIVKTSLGNSDDFANAIVCHPDQTIIIAGTTTNGAFLAKYDEFGNLDPEFGTDGILMTDFGTDENENYGLTIQDDGKIILTGVSGTNASNTNGNFGLARFNNDGSIDETFGTNGKLITDVSEGHNDVAFTVKLQNDGKIVAAGISNNGSYYNMSIARYYSGFSKVNENKSNEFFNISPNPTEDILYINFNSDKYMLDESAVIEITNSAGRIVKSQHISEVLSGIDLTDFPSGLYILRTVLDYSIIQRKFVVIKH